jgi:hypothetical protein
MVSSGTTAFYGLKWYNSILWFPRISNQWLHVGDAEQKLLNQNMTLPKKCFIRYTLTSKSSSNGKCPVSSGDDMDDHLDNALRYFGLEDIYFQRIAVTEEQIEQFNLPPMPKSKETIDKVNHDTRKNGFIRKYGKLYIVELDALLAIVPDEFKSIVQESVDQFFDQETNQAVLSDNRSELVDKLVHEKVIFV